MSIVIEDGTGLSTAESYISVADATTYFTARAVTSWGALATDALREAALRKATEYMIAMYRGRWQGWRKTEDQALCWPRYGVTVEGYLVDDDSVPETIKRACAELALKASAGELMPDLTRGVLQEVVGPISVTYDKVSPELTRYSFIEAMLKPYLRGGSKVNVPLYRV